MPSNFELPPFRNSGLDKLSNACAAFVIVTERQHFCVNGKIHLHAAVVPLLYWLSTTSAVNNAHTATMLLGGNSITKPRCLLCIFP